MSLLNATRTNLILQGHFALKSPGKVQEDLFVSLYTTITEVTTKNHCSSLFYWIRLAGANFLLIIGFQKRWSSKWKALKHLMEDFSLAFFF